MIKAATIKSKIDKKANKGFMVGKIGINEEIPLKKRNTIKKIASRLLR